MPRKAPPQGRLDMAGALALTGYKSDDTIAQAARAGKIPGAVQRTRKSPWSFTAEGLMRWLGIDDED